MVSGICFQMNLPPVYLRWSSPQTKEDQRHSAFCLFGLKNSYTPSTSKVWPSDHQKNYRSSTALNKFFLDRCTLTNKAVRTIWRVLSKPLQMRHDPDPRPLWLLIGIPSAIVQFWRSTCSLHWRMSLDIFDNLFLSPKMFVYWFLWPIGFGWLLDLAFYQDDYFFFNMCPFDYTAFAVSEQVGIP